MNMWKFTNTGLLYVFCNMKFSDDASECKNEEEDTYTDKCGLHTKETSRSSEDKHSQCRSKSCHTVLYPRNFSIIFRTCVL